MRPVELGIARTTTGGVPSPDHIPAGHRTTLTATRGAGRHLDSNAAGHRVALAAARRDRESRRQDSDAAGASHGRATRGAGHRPDHDG
ncbi:hypothetical protein, partial [Streptomyces sp. NPDC006996]|uniref:hypothetical protein n=1 Tax=Streptomyces sp. NPDC006996 TaxID=3156908 RepID=UPI0033E7352E